MYLPPQFNANDPALAAELIRASPFASLISVDDDGLPFVSHIPLHLVEQGAETLAGLTSGGSVPVAHSHSIVDSEEIPFVYAVFVGCIHTNAMKNTMLINQSVLNQPASRL